MEFLDTLWNHSHQHNSLKFHHAYDKHNNMIPNHCYDQMTHNKSADRSSISSDGYGSATPENSPVKKRSSESLNSAEDYIGTRCGNLSGQDDNGQNANYEARHGDFTQNFKHNRSDSGIYGDTENGPSNSDLLYHKSGVSEQPDNTLRPPNSIDTAEVTSNCWDVLPDPVRCPSQISQFSPHLNDIATEVLNENSCCNMPHIERRQMSQVSNHYNDPSIASKSCLRGEDTLTNNCSTIMDMLSIDNHSNDNNSNNDQRPLSAHPKFATYDLPKPISHESDKEQDLKNTYVDEDLLLYDEDINLSTSDLYLKSQGHSASNVSLNTSCLSRSDIALQNVVDVDSSAPMANVAFGSNKSLAEYMALFQELSGNPPGSHITSAGNQYNSNNINNGNNNQRNMTPNMQNHAMQLANETDQNYVKTYDPLMSSTCSIGMRIDSFDNLVHNSVMDFGRSFSVSNINDSTGNNNSYVNSSTGLCPTFNTEYPNNNSYSHYNSTSQCNLQTIPQLLNDLMASSDDKMLIGSTSSLSSISSIASSMSMPKKDQTHKVKSDSGTPPSNAIYEIEALANRDSHSRPLYQYPEPLNMSQNAPLGPRSYPTRLETDGSIIKSLLQPGSYNGNNSVKQSKQYTTHENVTGLKPSNDVTSTTDILPNPYYYQLNSQNPYMLGPPGLKRFSQPILPLYNPVSLPPINNMPMSGGSPFTQSNGARGCVDVRRASDSLVDTTESMAHEHSYHHHINKTSFEKNTLNLSYNDGLFGNINLKSYPNGKFLNALRSGSFTARSRDQRRAEALNIPFSIEEIIYSPIDEFTDILRKQNLTDAQISLIRDIRRRGKNKVAAQNCRKRKIDGIMTLEQTVDYLKAMKSELLQERTALEKDLQEQHIRYDGLYSKILTSLRDEKGCPYPPKDYMLQFSSDGNLFLIPKHHTSTSTLSSPLMMKLCDS